MIIAMCLEQMREAVNCAAISLFPDYPPDYHIPKVALETVEEIFNTHLDTYRVPKFLNDVFYDNHICELIDSSIICFMERYPSATIRRVEIINQHGEFYVYS